MKTLLILRHAKSSWSDTMLSDHDRPLKRRGRRDAPRMGALLRDLDLTPELIITSSAQRALQTAELVANASDYEGQLVVSRELYHADPEAYLAVVREVSNRHGLLMMVGHNPGIEELVEQLAGSWQRMPTAALAQIELDIDLWSDLLDDAPSRLVNLWLPRELES